MELGAKIKQLRCKAGLTQEQLAGRLGISAQSVSKWETAVTMPDIALLPTLAGELGVTIDELFDLSTAQRLHRIERRLETSEEIPSDIFKEYEDFLKNQLEEHGGEGDKRTDILGLLAYLYHHRMEADARRVSRYAREAIRRSPEEKNCQWLLQRAEGQYAWDWNVSNHTAIIDFYKQVIEGDTITPKTPLPYYYLIDNLIADHRTKEAETYLEECQKLPAHRPFLIPVYRAHIALAAYNEKQADEIMAEAAKEFSHDSGFLFETAQYHACKCDYTEAIKYYEQSWAADEDQKPRVTDALEGIAIIYKILGDDRKAADTYDRMIACLKDEWGCADDDAAVVDAEREKNRLLQK